MLQWSRSANRRTDLKSARSWPGRRDRGRLRRRRRVRGLVVEAARGAGGVGEPVDRDVGEDVVAVDGVAGTAVGPGELAGRRVLQRVRERLRRERLALVERAAVLVHHWRNCSAACPLRTVRRTRPGRRTGTRRPASRARRRRARGRPGRPPARSASRRRCRARRTARSRGGAISSAHARATRYGPSPSRVVGPENPKPGMRRDHEVERVGRIATVRARIGQRADHVEVLDDGPRPAVRQRSAASRPGSGDRTCRKWTADRRSSS